MEIPFYKQTTEWTCGVTVIRMALEAFGIKKTEEQILKLLKTSKRWGTSNKEMEKVVKSFGLESVILRNATLKDLISLSKQNYIIIVNYTVPRENIGHFAIFKKISGSKIYLIDPKFGPDHSHPIKIFEKVWHSERKEDYRWLLAIKK